MIELTPTVFYLGLAVALIGAELIILQLSVFWFLFFGIGALVVAIVGWFITLTWITSTALFFVASLLIALIAYPALKKWQNKPSPIAGNDAIGQRVEVTRTIGPGSGGKVQWSGSEWSAQLAEGESEISAGNSAFIVELEGIRLFVRREF
jgi:membrane protein implicated in regulation of membrane protease activity